MLMLVCGWIKKKPALIEKSIYWNSITDFSSQLLAKKTWFNAIEETICYILKQRNKTQKNI